MTHDFFLIYLPNQRGVSEHTSRSYQKAVDQLATHVAEKKGVSFWNVDFEMIDSKMLVGFLDSLEESGASIATRNQRLKAIRAFYTYAAMMSSALVEYRVEIYKVPFKKEPQSQTLEYLKEEAVKDLLSYPDTGTVLGIRDEFLLIFMYDTAARVQEVVDVRFKDIRLGKTPVVVLHGKGNKTRSVPLMKKTVEHFQAYCKIYHPNADPYSERPLFYSFRYKELHHMNQSTIRKMLARYGEKLKEDHPEISISIHPHLLRHSRAMHLYQHGMDLTLISQWLGHSKLETTLEFYARADTEQKREAIERATPEDSPLNGKLNAERYSVTDEARLKRLYGL